MKTTYKSITIIVLALAGLVLFPLSFLVDRAQAQTSYIIVHAHNPEGVEIASIQGMNASAVQIYDGNDIIGYGASSTETHNIPIFLPAGTHTIKAKFNGIIKEQSITLIANETKVVTFTFDRTEFDMAAFINGLNIFLECTDSGPVPTYLESVEKTCSLYDFSFVLYSLKSGYPLPEGVYSLQGKSQYTASNSVFILDSKLDWSVSWESNPYDRILIYTKISAMGHGLGNRMIIPISAWQTYSSFSDWIIQQIGNGILPPFEFFRAGIFYPMMSLMWSYPWQPMDNTYALRFLNAQEQIDKVAVDWSWNEYLSFSFFSWCGGYYYPPTPGGSYQNQNSGMSRFGNKWEGSQIIKMSSVPYDLTGTGVKDSGPLPTVDLSVKKVTIAQAVYYEFKPNTIIDLVNNRKTALFVTVRAKGMSGKSANVEVRMNGEKIDSTANNVIFATDDETQEIKILFTPNNPGDYYLTVVVDPQDLIPEIDENNNQNEPQVVKVRATKNLVIPYVRIKHPPVCFPSPCYGDVYLPEAENHVSQSNIFMEGTYPVPKGGFTGPLIQDEVEGYPWKVREVLNNKDKDQDQGGMIRDLERVLAVGKREYGDAKRVVGIVPEDYFDWYGNRIGSGVTHPSVPEAALVKVGDWATVAHEIGHTFGLVDDYINGPDYYPVNGYWVDKDISIEGERGFMGKMKDPYPPLELPKPPFAWVSENNWKSLISALDIQQKDPEMIIVGGIYYSDGLMEILPWYKLDTGIPASPIPGPYKIVVRDKNGSPLFDVPFDMPFTMQLDPIGTISTEVTGFAFSIAYPPEAAKIVLEDVDGTAIFEIEPNSKILRDAIEALPDTCFVKNASQRRGALLNKGEALGDIIDADKTMDAIQKLENDIRPHVQNWLFDRCEMHHALAATKEKILKLVDDIVQRLSMR